MEVREQLLICGPNRRSERTVIERQIVLSAAELEALERGGDSLRQRLLATPPFLAASGDPWLPSRAEPQQPPLAAFATLYTAMAIALQRAAAHRVGERGFHADSAGDGVWAWFEYEHEDVGARAAELALRWLAELEPGLGAPPAAGGAQSSCSAQYREFLAYAEPLLFPRDAEAIMAAATRMDIPCFKLEREPYLAVTERFRVRVNGLLKLGHCAHQQLVDGTFCLTRNARLLPLLHDREAMRRALAGMGVPLPVRDPAVDNCIVAKKAVRAAERIGYPVVARSGTRGGGRRRGLRSAEEVRAAVEELRQGSACVSIEAMVPGVSFGILVVNRAVLAAIHDGAEMPLAGVHATTLDLAARVARSLDAGMLLLEVVTPDASRPLQETGGAVVDCDLAPELDRLVSGASDLPERAGEQFVRWLYPPGQTGRIPIVAVTGTNGKTTTCHMIEHIMRGAGKRPGLVCSDGVFAQERFLGSRESIGRGAHHRIFELPEVDFAVLEEYFGRIARAGFVFDWCNVAVCTNVTNDHLGRIGTHTLEEMAELKFEVVRRARGAVVLNADDASCRAMAARASAERVCLVSVAGQSEASRGQPDGCRCVIETEDARPTIVIHDRAQRIPVIAIDDIPAAFGGAAAHNVMNAMQAAAACYFSGAGIDAITAGLATFRMSFESTPGRLNIFDGLPYRVIMDYAHNADGFRRLCEFTDRQPVSGRRIVMAGFSGDRRDDDIRQAIAVLAGHFDHFVCRNFRGLRGRPLPEIPALLSSTLQSLGVAQSAVDVVPEADAAVRHSLAFAAPGDLVVLLVGASEFQEIWDLLHRMADRSSG